MSNFFADGANQIYLIYGLIGIVLLLIILLVVLDRKDKKKTLDKPALVTSRKEQKAQVEEAVDIPIIEEAKPHPIEVEKKEQETIKYVEDDPELEKTMAQKELQRITEELRKAEAEEDQNNKIKLTNFEEEQEANAIISINELMKKSEALYDQNEVTQYQDEGNEPINLAELKAKANPPQKERVTPIKEVRQNVQMTLDDFASKEELSTGNNQKFKSSPFISPVYGLQKEDSPAKEDQIQIEENADLAQLDEEIRRTNEFLKKLKELKKNLQ